MGAMKLKFRTASAIETAAPTRIRNKTAEGKFSERHLPPEQGGYHNRKRRQKKVQGRNGHAGIETALLEKYDKSLAENDEDKRKDDRDADGDGKRRAGVLIRQVFFLNEIVGAAEFLERRRKNRNDRIHDRIDAELHRRQQS